MATIYLDIGHGGVDETGVDVGTKGTLNGVLYRENSANLAIGLKVIEVLNKHGHTVVTNRTENKNFSTLVGSYSRADSNLINSASYCKNTNCECMVSIHNNSYSDSSASGYVLIYKAGSEATEEVKTNSKRLCDCLEEQIKKTMPKNDVRKSLMSNGQDYYGILRLHDKVGVLCECGFMSNVDDMDRIINKADEIGTEIAHGIITYLGGEIIEDDTPIIDEKDKQIEALKEELTQKTKEIATLTTELGNVKKRLEKALAFDVDVNGVTDERDAVYLLKHIIDPKKFPLDDGNARRQ